MEQTKRMADFPELFVVADVIWTQYNCSVIPVVLVGAVQKYVVSRTKVMSLHLLK